MTPGAAMQTPKNNGRFLRAGDTPHVVMSSGGGAGLGSGAPVLHTAPQLYRTTKRTTRGADSPRVNLLLLAAERWLLQ